MKEGEGRIMVETSSSSLIFSPITLLHYGSTLLKRAEIFCCTLTLDVLLRDAGCLHGVGLGGPFGLSISQMRCLNQLAPGKVLISHDGVGSRSKNTPLWSSPVQPFCKNTLLIPASCWMCSYSVEEVEMMLLYKITAPSARTVSLLTSVSWSIRPPAH